MSARTCPCTCGGDIVVIAGLEADAVMAHNATSGHQLWRAKGGMEAEVRAVRLDQERVDARWISRELATGTPEWKRAPAGFARVARVGPVGDR